MLGLLNSKENWIQDTETVEKIQSLAKFLSEEKGNNNYSRVSVEEYVRCFKKGMSQEKIANKFGMTVSDLKKWRESND
ncbi:hypothetical protein GQR36_27555 [Enterococcus termitis]|nr:hypothetical protein RV18_GL002505 [Enterococcus termitis]